MDALLGLIAASIATEPRYAVVLSRGDPYRSMMPLANVVELSDEDWTSNGYSIAGAQQLLREVPGGLAFVRSVGVCCTRRTRSERAGPVQFRGTASGRRMEGLGA